MADTVINSNLYTLKKIKEHNDFVLEKIVIQKIKYSNKDYFILEEIAYLSEKFNIDIDKMLLSILGISQEDYCKLLKNNIKRIYSKNYINMKNAILRKKKIQYMKKINLNKRNYYNKQQILENAEREEINCVDFVTGILGKKRTSMRRVIKDESNKSRLYIGKYINCALPMEYYHKHYDEMQPIIKNSVWGFFRKFNVHYNKKEFDEMVQSSNLFLLENGNGLNKNNTPIIKEGNKFRKKHKKMLYNKSFYYLIRNMEDNKLNMVEYNEARATKGLPPCDSEEMDDVFNRMFTDEKENRIFRKFIKYRDFEDKFEIIANEEGMEVEEVRKLFEERKKLWC